MKILVLGTRGFPDVQGGIEKHCEELYPRLAALGCEVTVISRAPYTGPASYMYKGVYMLPIACPKHKWLEAFFHTFFGIWKATKLKCDVLHIHAIGPSIFVPLARLLGFKVVMTHHGPDYERKKWNGLAKMILKLGEKWGVTFAHEVIVISQAIFQRVREKFGREGKIIPNGVVVTERVQENSVLKNFELDRGKYFLAVGRFVPEKGFAELLESFQHLNSLGYSRWNRWKLVFVGDSDHEDKFSREFKTRSKTVPDVVLTGFQSGKTLQELYSHAGHFVLPSYHEGLPIVLLEALSYGSSCLVSDIPANREINLEEERYFKPGNVVQMTRKLKRFIDRPVTEEERTKRIQQITDRYNWTEISHKTLDVYNNLFTL